MAESATSAGLPHPEIEERGDCVTFRFRRVGDVQPGIFEDGLTELQCAILREFRRSGRLLALREIRTMVGLIANERRLREDVAVLKAKGLTHSTGRGRCVLWKSL